MTEKRKSAINFPKRNKYVSIAILSFFIVILAGIAAYLSYDKFKSEKEYELPPNAIVVRGAEFLFRNNISDFMTVHTSPYDGRFRELISTELDYYTLRWYSTCERDGTCGIISLAAVDIPHRVGFVYSLVSGTAPDYIINSGNNSITVFLKKENSLEYNLSKLRGLEIILATPGETNKTRISAYNLGNIHRVVIEGNSSHDFLRAVDKFNYLILKGV